MAVPAVSIIWDDQSAINKVNTVTEDTVDRPIIMVASSADKGPEEWKLKMMGQTFYDYYGQVPSFSKHGQPLIQAANAIDAGAYVTFKRIVADDATLANIGIVAELKYTSVGYTDPTTGMFVWEYKDPSGVVKRQFSNTDPSTSSKTYTQVFTNQVNVAFKAVTYNLGGTSVGANSNKPSDFANQLYNTYAHKGTVGSNDQTYPLFMITDNGRGESKKRFRISRDTTSSRPVNYVRYFIEVMENDKTLETFAFTLNPDIIEKDRNINLQNVITHRSHQIRCVFFEDEYDAFSENVASLLNVTTSIDTDTLITTGITADEFKRQDPIFGTDFYGNNYTYLKCDYSILNNIFGIQLANGTNGSFGDAPIKAASYSAQLVQAFDGTFDDSIYDLDNNRIDAIFDANYPNPVKRAIEDLVTFREDCMYFRDMGLGLSSIGNIQVNDKFNLKNRFCATYLNSYDIFDPYTRKQISVTVTYDLVRLFVKHFINGRTRPFCGDKYGVVIPLDNMVPGTLNFSPKRTPSLDQKQELDDLRINYLSFYDGNILAMNSEYTSQNEYTQLSWINNVLAVQQVIKAIRVLCPKIRYSFLDGEDLQNYKKDVQNLIVDKYSSLFKSFSIEYVEDGTYESNKIIYACLYAKFRNFIQTEIFKIIALQS